MTNLICFDYMHFKSLILQTFTFICTTEFTSITPAAQAFLEQSPLPAVPSLEMLPSCQTISLTDKNENEPIYSLYNGSMMGIFYFVPTDCSCIMFSCLSSNCSSFF